MKYLIITLMIVTGFVVSCSNEPEEETHPSCAGNHGAEEAAGAHEEEVAEIHTGYSNSFELYLEFHPLIANQEIGIKAFISDAKTFSPVDNCNITLSLIKGKKGIRNVTEGSKGIYSTSIQPKDAGKYKLVAEISNGTITEKVTFDNIEVFADEAKAIASIKHDENEILIPKEKVWETDFASVLVEKQPFYEIIKTSGEILPAIGDENMVSAKHSGIIIYNKNITIGEKVNKGQILFTISGSEMTHDNFETKFNETKMTFLKDEIDYNRALDLQNDKIISDREFQEVKLRYETSKNRFDIMKLNYVSGGQVIRAPMNGFIKSLPVLEGQFVEIGQPLAKISQNKRLMIKADVSQKYFAKLSQIASANFTTPYNSKTYHIEELNGKLSSYGKTTGNSEYYTSVFFEIDNTEELISGSYIEVYLKTKIINDAIVIPNESLMEEYGNYFVFVQKSGTQFEKRYIKKAGSDGINTLITSGVNHNERVVCKGAYRIKLASMSEKLPASHVH